MSCWPLWLLYVLPVSPDLMPCSMGYAAAPTGQGLVGKADAAAGGTVYVPAAKRRKTAEEKAAAEEKRQQLEVSCYAAGHLRSGRVFSAVSLAEALGDEVLLCCGFGGLQYIALTHADRMYRDSPGMSKPPTRAAAGRLSSCPFTAGALCRSHARRHTISAQHQLPP